MALEDYSEAEECFRRILTLAPDSLETLLNLGYVLDLQGRQEAALCCYESVLKISPENPKARYNRAAHLLRSGDLMNGFADYEFRFAANPGADNRNYSQSRWDGSTLVGRSILVYCEQGLGDALMFARYLPLLNRLGARVILEAQEPLIPLLSLMKEVELVVAKSSSPPAADVHIPLLSLPFMFQTTLDSIPNRVPYLSPPCDLAAIWRDRLRLSPDKLNIGLVWAGKAQPYPNRSCPPEYLKPLLSLPDVRFYSLQVGAQGDNQLSRETADAVIDLTSEIRDFADSAALIVNLDLVITIDTSVAHLAGALGKPVWVLLPALADWRWLLNRNDSPWYPTMRLFRQPQAGDWSSVISEIVQALQNGFLQKNQTESSDDVLELHLQKALKNVENATPEQAITQLTDLLKQLPDDPAIWFNLGRAYDLKGQPAKAVKFFRQALRLSPDSPSIWLRFGTVLLKQKSYAEAEASLQKAHDLAPESIDILLVLGEALVQQGKLEKAFDCCKKMLSIDPACVEAMYNLAYLQLRKGDYQAGFANFEARLEMKSLKIDDRSYLQPRWDGAPLEGRSILVFGEQGLGDVIQFSRYLPLVAERGGKVFLEVDPPLIPLFRDFPGVFKVIPKTTTPPMTDVYVQLLSLPYFFGTTQETIPGRIPYIQPDVAKEAEWRQLLADETACRVGLVWRGNPRNPLDQDRSCPLALLVPLASLPGVRFFSLQVGAGTAEVVSLDASINLVNHTDRLNDLSDTAAFIANLDLVIGVDTAVVHLAGAMGKPVWILLSPVADWRWIVGRLDSPWYPSARVFWQERRGDWGETISFVKNELEKWLGEKKTSHGFGEIEALYDLGGRLKENGDLIGAEDCFRRITSVNPDLPDPQHSLGVVLQMQGRPREAIEHYKSAIAQDPCFVQALYNLANALVQSGRSQEAVEVVHALLRCDAEHADAHWLLGMLLLLHGDYLDGWKEYEWRWQAKAFLAKIPALGRPLWDGSPLGGKTLLIQMEQGRGDMIQFIRYAPIAAAMGGRVVVRAVPDLVPLLLTAEGVSQVVDQNEALPDFDVYIPAMSLPHVLGTTLDTIPSQVPYLRPDPRRTEAWNREMPTDGRFRIGLVWQGSSENRDNENRSCALAEFKPLADLAGVVFYSLQIGAGTEQLLPTADSLDILDVSDRIHDFADTAALIENLDLVISVCTSVAHLAGAMGRPVWTLLHFASDWRWLLERRDSPWYPSMKLFRQEAPGDWAGLIAKVRQELAQMLASAEFHNQRGIVMLQSGNLARAEQAFSRAVALDQEYAEAHCNRGVVLHELGRLDEAFDCYQAALSYHPDFQQALFNMGNTCRSLGRMDQARVCYKRVLELKPEFVPSHLCLGEIAKELKEFTQARSHYDQALSIDISCVEAFQGLAETYQAEEEFEQAISSYHMVLARQPNRTATWNLLGTVYHGLEKLDEAEYCYRQALALLPEQSTMLNNLGVVLTAQGRLDEAVDVFHHQIGIDTNDAEGHWNFSVALLAMGAFSEGWHEYEWRFKKVNPVPERAFPQPRWDGSPLNGQTILLHAEQGFGDTIQFVRYVPLVVQRGGRVIVECQVPALKRLLLSLEGVAEVVVAGDLLPSFDCHLPLMSLPLVFGTTLETVPSQVPYLVAETADIEAWKRRLGPSTKFRVGLVWFAKQSQVLNRKRSCPLQMFAPLWAVTGVEFYTLQVGPGSEQLEDFAASHEIIDYTHDITDFADTAAFIANLDLVITIDTVVAHLAGALGARTWVALPHVAEWRWLCQREDSPWYPGMRLFRQPSPGDWPSLMDTVAGELYNCVNVFVVENDAPPAPPGIFVGLAWSGRQDNPLNRKRSCPFSSLAPLFDLKGITFVKLQMDSAEESTAKMIDLTDQIRDFEDTAALMANLDLIISIDTSVAHLAAATGRPTWVLLSHVADWRWSPGRNHSIWYPEAVLFRQAEFGDWEGVVQEVADRLSRRFGGHVHNPPEPSLHVSAERFRLEQLLKDKHQEAARIGADPDALLDVGTALALLGRDVEAAEVFRHVLELDPDHVAGHLNLAYSLLAVENYPETWEHFEWRLKRLPPDMLPPWPMLNKNSLGTHSAGSTVLVHCEQGYGDTIQFSRFLPLLAETGYRVIVSCQPQMSALVASIPGISSVIPHGEALPVCDLQVLLLSLPGLFGVTPASLPVKIPYLVPGKQGVETWKKRLEEKNTAA